MSYKTQVSFIVSSKPSLGAVNITPGGGQFSVNLENALSVPSEAINVTLEVDQASYVFNFPNISSEIGNDTIEVSGPTQGGGSQTVDIVIPKGLYDINGLNTFLEKAFTENGFQDEIAGVKTPLFQFVANNNTQKAEVLFNFTATSFFLGANSPYVILGWPEGSQVGAVNTAPSFVIPPEVAAFNSVNGVAIHTDLVISSGIPVNNVFSGIVGLSLISVPVGGVERYEPVNPPYVNCESLRNADRTQMTWWLTSIDNPLEVLDCQDEPWSARVTIKYSLPLPSK